MSTNKNAQIRYNTLDKCFRNFGRKYYIDDLVEQCCKAIYDFDQGDGVRKRQIYDDIKFMKSSQGFDAPIESFREGRRTYYQYTNDSFKISNQPLNESEAKLLKDVFSSLGRFKGTPQFHWIDELSTKLESEFAIESNASVIEYEENPYAKGLEYIKDIFHAIINKKVLKIHYLKFNSKEPNIYYKFHPHYLKQYNKRWYLFGFNDEYDSVTSLPLDRIESLVEVNFLYKSSKIDFQNEYFDDIVGVTVNKNNKLIDVSLKVDSTFWPYMRTQPIHHTQKHMKKLSELEANSEIVDFRLRLNNEFKNYVFTFSEHITVLRPSELVSCIKLKAKSVLNRYK